MIVSEVMTATSKLVTVAPNDTLGHAASLLRQHQFHHLPVVRKVQAAQSKAHAEYWKRGPVSLEGIVTTQEIELAVAIEKQASAESDSSWQDRPVAEVMRPASMTVSSTTGVAAAARILVERGLNYLPVVDYSEPEQQEQPEQAAEPEAQAVLVGLLTRSDLLMALARSTGAFEPGVDVVLPLTGGNMIPLANMLLLAAELHIQVRSVLASPLEGGTPHVATVRLGTIYPTPLLMRLHAANIEYRLAGPESDGDLHA